VLFFIDEFYLFIYLLRIHLVCRFWHFLHFNSQSQLRWFLWFSWEAEPELTGGIIHPIRPGNASGCPRRSWRGGLGFPAGPVGSDPTSDQRRRMDDYTFIISFNTSSSGSGCFNSSGKKLDSELRSFKVEFLFFSVKRVHLVL